MGTEYPQEHARNFFLQPGRLRWSEQLFWKFYARQQGFFRTPGPLMADPGLRVFIRSCRCSHTTLRRPPAVEDLPQLLPTDHVQYCPGAPAVRQPSARRQSQCRSEDYLMPGQVLSGECRVKVGPARNRDSSADRSGPTSETAPTPRCRPRLRHSKRPMGLAKSLEMVPPQHAALTERSTSAKRACRPHPGLLSCGFRGRGQRVEKIPHPPPAVCASRAGV